MLVAGSLDARAAERAVWEHSPYRVLATLAVDDHSRPQLDLPTSLSGQIAARVEGSLRPLWDFKIDSPDAGAARRQCFELREIPWDELSADQKANDKLLWLGVRVLPHGYELAAREFDVHMRRWGPVQRRVVQQSSFLAEASFELLQATFSPLAMVEPIEGNDEQVQLVFRGSQLPRPSGEESFVTPGEAYLPLLRRTDRSGKVIEGGILPVPWTYLTATEANDAGWLASVHSGVRRPFGTGKKGLVEQIAVGLRLPPGATPVRFHARTDKSQGLAGYEVFRETPDGGSERVGVTDRNGMIVVPPNGAAVSMLMLRSDGQVLAKVPVASGGSDVQQTPIADNVTRLQAQAEAQVVREELIDLVARRAIVMGRVKAMLKKNRIDDAKELMSELDAMPSPSVFGRTIENAARRIPKSDDASVQKRIDSLFSSTRDMLTKFLNTRPVTELQDQVNEAAKTQPPAAAETTEAPADAAAPTS
ncbi:hypothetical protein [Lacipirellula limnantheis]|uniref:Uncharacterized protein n=1 Tax=Lacipirellula limnantheis TaxID=2528024 RepID=A0A517TZW2_9BACT|nr:hypothetical protein [Lacipirellula limnantheis]QDT73901.1 hypothetical protein I41_30930 [Lacipirellula limnantheis]